MIKISSVKVDKQTLSIDTSQYVREMYHTTTPEVTNWQASEFYTQVINPLRVAVESYTGEFDNAVRDYMAQNSVLGKMKNSLSPSRGQRTNKINLPQEKYKNNKYFKGFFIHNRIL